MIKSCGGHRNGQVCFVGEIKGNRTIYSLMQLRADRTRPYDWVPHFSSPNTNTWGKQGKQSSPSFEHVHERDIASG